MRRLLALCLASLLAVSLVSIQQVEATHQSSLRGTEDALEDAAINEEQQQERQLLSMQWDYEFVQRASFTHALSKMMKRLTLMDEIEYWNEYYQSFMAWDDGWNDRSLVVKEDDVCHVHFKAQSRNALLDIWQTLSPFVKYNAFGTGCDVRRSFYNAYEAPYIDDLRAETTRCVKSCTDSDCPLILSGTSVGGSSAMIASLDPFMKQYNPTVIVTGPLRAIINDDCDQVDIDNIFRIVTANAGVYDAASDGSPKMGRHFGHFFILDEMNGVYYISANDNVLRSPDTYNIHIVETYINRLEALANRDPSEFPITLTQFPDGHWCTQDDECNSGSSCGNDGVCSTGGDAIVVHSVGAPCTAGSDCTSGMCMLSKCTMDNGLLAVGSPCEEHANCDTDKCTEGFCTDKTFNGSWCKNDWDCVSNSCAGPLSWILMRRCTDPDE